MFILPLGEIFIDEVNKRFAKQTNRSFCEPQGKAKTRFISRKTILSKQSSHYFCNRSKFKTHDYPKRVNVAARWQCDLSQS